MAEKAECRNIPLWVIATSVLVGVILGSVCSCRANTASVVFGEALLAVVLAGITFLIGLLVWNNLEQAKRTAREVAEEVTRSSVEKLSIRLLRERVREKMDAADFYLEYSKGLSNEKKAELYGLSIGEIDAIIDELSKNNSDGSKDEELKRQKKRKEIVENLKKNIEKIDDYLLARF